MREHPDRELAPAAFRAGKSGLNEELVYNPEVTGQLFFPLLLFPGGNDLLAAGLSEGPEIGVRLRSALETKRQGRAGDREAELRAALAANIERGGGQSS